MVSILLLCGVLLLTPAPGSAADKVGVLFAVHGGFSQYARQYLWDASMQMFSYEPNHAVYTYVDVVSDLPGPLF